MMSANARAWAPVLIASPGWSRPSVSSAASSVAVMFCALISSRTVFRPVAPIAIAPMPNAISMTLAAIPPYANHLFMTTLLSSADT